MRDHLEPPSKFQGKPSSLSTCLPFWTIWPGTRLIVHEKPGKPESWGHHVTPGWYIILSLDHFRCMQCYIPATGIVRITDTLQ